MFAVCCLPSIHPFVCLSILISSHHFSPPSRRFLPLLILLDVLVSSPLPLLRAATTAVPLCHATRLPTHMSQDSTGQHHESIVLLPACLVASCWVHLWARDSDQVCFLIASEHQRVNINLYDHDIGSLDDFLGGYDLSVLECKEWSEGPHIQDLVWGALKTFFCEPCLGAWLKSERVSQVFGVWRSRPGRPQKCSYLFVLLDRMRGGSGHRCQKHKDFLSKLCGEANREAITTTEFSQAKRQIPQKGLESALPGVA